MERVLLSSESPEIRIETVLPEDALAGGNKDVVSLVCFKASQAGQLASRYPLYTS